MKKYIIYTLAYSEDIGGVIALHKLCDLLNKSGYEAYLYPSIFPEGGYDLYSYNISSVPLMNQVLNRVFSITQTLSLGTKISPDQIPEVFWVNQFFNTPVYKPDPNISFGEEWVVIYPEVTFGNPLRAKNVVRWLLHNPGFHTGKIYYGVNELYFRYSEAFDKFQYPGSKTSDLILMILYLPLDIFYESKIPQERKGTAYLVRKGNGRKIMHNLENSIPIDGKSNSEIADIFRSVETFISYDPSTLYSNLAVLCGCQSVVMPLEGVAEDKWKPNYISYGVSYGFENISKAKKTAPLVRDALLLAEVQSEELVKSFVKEVEDYFN